MFLANPPKYKREKLFKNINNKNNLNLYMERFCDSFSLFRMNDFLWLIIVLEAKELFENRLLNNDSEKY